MSIEVILVSAAVGALLTQAIPGLYRVLIPRTRMKVEVLDTDIVTALRYREALDTLSRIDGRQARAALKWHADLLGRCRQQREYEERMAAEKRLRDIEHRLADVEKRGF